jgi:hypothetical protein
MMGSPAINNLVLVEPTFRRALRIWWSWLWRFALLGGIPVILAGSADYYNHHLPEPSGLVALVIFLTIVVVPFWAYRYTFRVIFEKTFAGLQVRLQPLSLSGSANQPQTFVAPTKLRTREVRKKWTRRSWRWGLGFLVALLVFGAFAADGALRRLHAGPDSAEALVASFLIIVMFCGAPLGWLVGSAWELKSIFKEDFGEFRVCLTSEPCPCQQG